MTHYYAVDVKPLTEQEKLRPNDSAETRVKYLLHLFEQLDSKQQVKAVNYLVKLSNGNKTA